MSTNARFEHINMDIVGPLPLSKDFMYCLTMIDRLNRWPEAVLMTDMTVETVENTFINYWISKYGTASRISTDLGRQCESTLFKKINRMLGVTHLKTTLYHPQANGIIEKWHRTFKAAIKCHDTNDWIEILPIILLGMWTTFKADALWIDIENTRWVFR